MEKDNFFFVHMNLQNRGVYYYNLCIFIKSIPFFFLEKTAEPAFVVVVETYQSFAVALRQIAVVVSASAVTDSAVVAAKLEEFAPAVAVVLAL